MNTLADTISPRQRLILTVTVMAVSSMASIDTAITFVVLPTLQGALSATRDQLGWVVTSYVVMGAIGIPLAGALARPLGFRRIFIVALVGFGVSSTLCGMATGLPEMVLFRAFQGFFGACFYPLVQSLLLDIYPREDHPKAVTLVGLGMTIGPAIGASLGGFLTEALNWRWVFFINIPIMVLALISTLIWMPRVARDRSWSFDFLGFGLFCVAICSGQLMLDRGHQLEWFEAPEIITYAIVGGLASYLFVIQSSTGRNVFIDPRIFRDTFFAAGLFISILAYFSSYITPVLVPQFLQNVQGRSVSEIGLIMMFRGFGVLTGGLFASRMVRVVSPPVLILLAIAVMAIPTLTLARLSVDSPAFFFCWTGMMQSFGIGLLFMPTTLLAYSTLMAELRPIATSVWVLACNVSNSVGISCAITLLSRNADDNYVRLSENLSPYNPNLQVANVPPQISLSDPVSVAVLAKEVGRQSFVVGLNTVFDMQAVLMLGALVCLSVFFLLLRPSRIQSQRRTEVP